MQAGSIVQTFTVEERATNWAQTLSVNPFDPELGTLQEVVFDYTESIHHSGSFTNTGNGTGIFSATFTDNLSLTDWDGELVASAETVIATGSVYLTKADGPYTFDLGVQTFGGQIRRTDDLTPFIGDDSIDFLLSASAWVYMTGSGNSRMSVRTTASGSLSVTYNYMDAPAPDESGSVPEPSAPALLALGLAALTLSRRRSDKSDSHDNTCNLGKYHHGCCA